MSMFFDRNLAQARTLPELVDAADFAGLGTALDAPLRGLWEGEAGRTPAFILLRALLNTHGDQPLGAVLSQPALWNLLKSRFTASMRKTVLAQVRAHLEAVESPESAIVAPAAPLTTDLPRTERELEEWARAAGVYEDLSAPLVVLQDRLGPAELQRLRMELGYFITVGTLVVGGGRRSDPLRSEARRVAVAWLLEQAALVELAIREEQTPPEAPQDLALARLFERLTALRTRLRETAAPIPREVARSGQLHVLPSPLALAYRDPRPSITSGSGMQFHPVVYVPLEREGPLDLRCECFHSAEGACRHQLAAVDCVQQWLTKGDAEALGRLAAELSKAPWERALSAVEGLVSKAEGPLAEPGSRLIWRLTAGVEEALGLRPFLQRVAKRGGYTAGSTLRLTDIVESGSPQISDEDRAAASLLGTRGREPSTVPGALSLLARTGRVFLEGEPLHPLRIERAAVGLLCEERPEGYVLVPAAADCALPEELVRFTRGSKPVLRQPVFVDPTTHRCFLFDDSSRALEAFALLLERGTTFPREAGPVLAERLERTGLALELPPTLLGAELPASVQPAIFFSRGEGLTFRLELRVRPLPGGLPLPVADGPVRVRGQVADVRSFVVRDFAGEQREADALWERLAVPGEGNVPEVAGAEALELLRRLETLAREGLEVVWPPRRPTFSRPALKRDLRLTVREGRDWFGLQGEAEVDGQTLKLAALLEAARERRRYVPVGEDHFVELSDALSAQLSSLSELVFEGKHGPEISLAAAGEVEALGEELGGLEVSVSFRGLAAQIRASGALEPRVPQGLRAELRPYQRRGLPLAGAPRGWGAGARASPTTWGSARRCRRWRCSRTAPAAGPALVVAPTSVCFNWRREAAALRAGAARAVAAAAGGPRGGARRSSGRATCWSSSYGLLVRDAERFAALRFATAGPRRGPGGEERRRPGGRGPRAISTRTSASR